MIFVIDEQLPPALVELFKSKGFGAVHVRELGLKGAADFEVWHYVELTRAIIVTKDLDFLPMAELGGLGRLLWLRVGNCSNAALLAFVESRWTVILGELNRQNPVIELL